jgi:hypothetical protein
MPITPRKCSLRFEFPYADMEFANFHAQGMAVGLISKSSQVGYILRVKKVDIGTGTRTRIHYEVMADVQWIKPTSKRETINIAKLFNLQQYVSQLSHDRMTAQNTETVYKKRLEDVLMVRP